MSSSQDTSLPQTDDESILSRIIRALKKLFLITIIYVFASYGFSIAWLYLAAIIFFLTKKWTDESREKWDIARAMALGYEKEFLLKKLHYLPSWVNFPDIERVEWLNRIIRQAWTRVNHYTRDLVLKVIEPTVQKYLKGFKFDKVILGHVPFRIDGIKVYEEQDITRDKIVMDADISYAGDCHISFQVSGFKGGIENFQLRGRLRIVMKPLISKMPLIGGLQVYFMREPEIDFDLTGVTQILSIPGLRQIIQNSVIETINSMLLFPNIYPIKLSHEVPDSEISIFEPEGVLRVHVIEAKHLMKKDIGIIGTGKSDPYAVLSIGPKVFKTKIIDSTVDPVWDEWFEFDVETNSDLKIHVWDYDSGSKDETLGTAKISVSEIAKKGKEDMKIPLQGVMHGMIHVNLTWMTFSKNPDDLDLALKETQTINPFLHTALLIFYLDSAKNIHESKTLADPYVKISVEKTVHESKVVKQNPNPIFEQNFIFMLVSPQTAILDLKIIDKKSGNDLGEISYQVSNILTQKNLEMKGHPFVLRKSGAESYITCTMKLLIFINEFDETIDENENNDNIKEKESTILKKQESIKSRKSEIDFDPEEDQSVISSEYRRASILSSDTDSDFGMGIQLTLRYSMQSATLSVVVHQVRNIPCKAQSDLPDPYVKLYLLPPRSKVTKRKTRSVKDSCNPVFDESFQFSGIRSTDLNSLQLEVTVASQKTFGNKILGQALINFAQFSNLTQSVNDWFDLVKHLSK